MQDLLVAGGTVAVNQNRLCHHQAHAGSTSGVPTIHKMRLLKSCAAPTMVVNEWQRFQQRDLVVVKAVRNHHHCKVKQKGSASRAERLFARQPTIVGTLSCSFIPTLAKIWSLRVSAMVTKSQHCSCKNQSVCRSFSKGYNTQRQIILVNDASDIYLWLRHVGNNGCWLSRCWWCW